MWCWKKMLWLGGLCAGIFAPAEAQVSVVKNGRSGFSIQQTASGASYRQAAQILQKQLLNSTHAKLPIKTGSIRCNNCIVITTLGEARKAGLYTGEQLRNDGVILDVQPGRILLVAQQEETLDYPVYEFLWKYLNTRCYAPGAIAVKHIPTLSLPVSKFVYSPPFEYRDVFYANANNEQFRRWNHVRHISSPDSEWGNFVHTIGQFIGFSRYFKSNPEYFALVGGKRTPTQLCYSNRKVYNIVRQNLREAMKSKPGKTVWSVSQQDNNDFCQCNNCTAINKKLGASSGAMIQFVNNLAKETPEKIISTLAYGRTLPAPSNIQLADNLQIFFCATYGNKARSITTDQASQQVRNYLDNWLKLTSNIIVWDYVVNFRNLMVPLPNYFILGDNIRFYRQKGIKSLFIQGNNQEGGEFAGLRTFLLSRLLWDPSVNDKQLIQDYINFTYDLAATDIFQLLQGLQKASVNAQVSNYDDPYIYNNSIFTNANMTAYNAILDKAVARAQTSKSKAAVKEVATWINFTEVEILKRKLASGIEKQVNIDKLRAAHARLADALGKDTSTALDEGKRSISQYMNGNEQLLNGSWRVGKMLASADITAKYPAAAPYNFNGPRALIDGMQGSPADLTNFWQGFYGVDVDVSIDLKSLQMVRSIDIALLSYPAKNVYLPATISCFYSMDGRNYTLCGKQKFQPRGNMKEQIEKRILFQPGKKIRYIRIVAEKNNFDIKSWIFTDEIVVK